MYIFFVLFFLKLTAQDIVINEIMSSNFYTIQDEDGDYEDWIELYNVSNTSINLENYSISDDESNPQRWTFPSVEIPPNGFLLIFASGKDRYEGPYLHTNFSISAFGEPIILSNPNNQTIDFYDAIEILTDRSYGRKEDGLYPLLYFNTPTPGYSNSQDYQYPSESTPLFSHSSGFYDTPFNLELSTSNPLYEIRYSLNGSNPTNQSTLYENQISIFDRSIVSNNLSNINTGLPDADDWFVWRPPLANVDKATVIKAQLFYNDIPVGEVSTQTYFVGSQFKDYNLPIISLVTDSTHLFDYDKGIYVAGRVYDEEFRDWYWGTGNFHKRGRDWERKAHVTYFEPSKEVGFSQNIGVRIHGGGSRSLPIKSLRFYTRSSYGNAFINYKFFEELNQESFNRILLRNSGQDFDKTFFRDALCHTLIKDLDIESQHYRPSILFINGEYWGLHNIRERIDKHYLAYRKNIDPNNIDLVDFFVASEGSKNHYDAFIHQLGQMELKDSMAYNYISSIIDVDNYIDYMIAKIYFATYDWPGNNLLFWREKNDNSKYRWINYDNDDAFDDYNFNALAHTSEINGESWPNPPNSTILFRYLLQNEMFVEKLLAALEFHLKETFRSEKVIDAINKLYFSIKPYLPKHIERWTYPYNMNEWERQVTKARTFAIKRPCVLKFHFADKFNLNVNTFLPDFCNDLSENPYSSILIYPSPNNGDFSIRFMIDHFEGRTAIYNIYNTLGQLVYSNERPCFKGANFLDFELKGTLNTGTYVLQIVSKDFKISSKFMIQQ